MRKIGKKESVDEGKSSIVCDMKGSYNEGGNTRVMKTLPSVPYDVAK